MIDKKIIYILLAILFLIFIVFGGKSTADKYYENFYSKQIESTRDMLKKGFEEDRARMKAELEAGQKELQASRKRIQDKETVIRGFSSDIALITPPEGLQDIVNRYGGLGYEAHIYNSI